MTDTIQLTAEQIAKYRVELADNPDALAALNVIEECEGNLQDAIILMRMRETGTEPDKSLDLDELAAQCRPLICSDLTKTSLDILTILTGLFGTYGVALAVLIYIFNKYREKGLKDFCQEADSTS